MNKFCFRGILDESIAREPISSSHGFKNPTSSISKPAYLDSNDLISSISNSQYSPVFTLNRFNLLLFRFSTVYLRLTLLNSSWLRFQFSSIVSTIVSSFLIRSSEKFRSISVSCLNCDSKQNENVTYAKKMMREERILTRRSHSANASIVIQVCILNSSFFYYFRFTRIFY